MIYIGIDPGKHTGFAVWNGKEQAFVQVETLPIYRAITSVLLWALAATPPDGGPMELTVVFEDARQRTWYGKGDVSAKQQGAGSIKRDCAIWEELCLDRGIPYIAQAPVKGATKVSPAYFRQVSGWDGRTSSHARDAAMLVVGR